MAVIDPATAKIIGWMGRVVAVALLIAFAVLYSRAMATQEDER